ncbi:hypothetical protein IFM89_028072 [Coptis chinensis]|uniref:Uncharacterized protein n=1 Tax=Coptis chinensis TaxID=261450 RepID=A0A835LKS4_9MAGN|nr:hypothetical protein IFM89_028072 [Coptis chinensis]
MEKTQRITFTPYHHPTRQFSLYSIVTISTTNDKKRYISCSAGGKTVDEPVDVKQGEKNPGISQTLEDCRCETWTGRRLGLVREEACCEGLGSDTKSAEQCYISQASGRTNGYFLHSVMCSLSVLQVNDGSCLLNMQCVINSDVDGYDQVARVRNALAYATHKFFQENGFVWVSSPNITASDCEGAEEQFCVTKLILCDL